MQVTPSQQLNYGLSQFDGSDNEEGPKAMEVITAEESKIERCLGQEEVFVKDDSVAIPFTSEFCLQSQIAYVISTIAISFLRKMEVAIKTKELKVFDTVCLSKPNYLQYSDKCGEFIGKIFLANNEGDFWEERELYQTSNVEISHFISCLAGKYVTKEFCDPPLGLKGHVEQLKGQIPVVAEIWKHLHRLLKELSPVVCNAEEWKKAVKLAKYHRLGEDKTDTNSRLNFGNFAVAANHVALQTFILNLAEKQSDFLSCYDEVCNQWENLKGRWQSESNATDSLSLRMTQIRFQRK